MVVLSDECASKVLLHGTKAGMGGRRSRRSNAASKVNLLTVREGTWRER